MSTKKNLPWKVAPKPAEMIEVGKPEYGVLEIPKKGSLTINEAQFIRDETEDLPDIQQQAIQLASDIAKEENIDFVEAFEALMGGSISTAITVASSAKKNAGKFEVEPLPREIPMGAIAIIGDAQVAITKAAPKESTEIFCEALPDALAKGDSITVSLPNELAKKNTVKLMQFQKESAQIAPLRNAVLATAMLRRIMGNDWTIDQTSEDVPANLVADLAEFCGKEMNGWDAPETKDEPVTEETLKND